MAQSKNNEITHGATGKFGKLIVFRQRGEKTLMAKRPRLTTVFPSAKQQAIREKFGKATIYGKKVMADALLLPLYEAVATVHLSAYNLAIRDFFDAPQITEIDVTAYTGAAGSLIKITATDDFKVKAVTVKITQPDGTLVESGNAVQQSDGPEWIYTTTIDNFNRVGDKLTVSATDLPENVTVKEMILS